MGSEVGDGEIKVAVDSGTITVVGVASGSAATFGTDAQEARRNNRRTSNIRCITIILSLRGARKGDEAISYLKVS